MYELVWLVKINAKRNAIERRWGSYSWKDGRARECCTRRKNHINNVAVPVIAAAFGFAATVPLTVSLPSFATELLGL